MILSSNHNKDIAHLCEIIMD